MLPHNLHHLNNSGECCPIYSNMSQCTSMFFSLHVLTGFCFFKSIIILIKFIDLLYTIWVYKSVVKAYEWSHHWLDEQMFEPPPPATPGKASPRSQRTRAGFEDHAGTKDESSWVENRLFTRWRWRWRTLFCHVYHPKPLGFQMFSMFF